MSENNSNRVLVDGLNNVSNEVYHADRYYLSSSVLKVLNESLEKYHSKYILGIGELYSAATQASFLDGSYTHSLLLEPETIKSEYNFYQGLIKRGREFDEFMAGVTNGKPVISAAQVHRAEKLASSYRALPITPDLLTGGAPEQTICGTLHGVPIKTRFDYINWDKGYIADVKTTASEGELDFFKMTIDKYKYQLSGALYCQMAEQYYGKPFEFYFIVLSKKDFSAHVYKMSKETRAEGDELVLRACKKYLRARETNIWTETSQTAIVLSSGDYEIEEV